MALDHWTSESLRAMVKYIADDRKIARHLAIPLREVVAARKRLGPGGRRPAAVKEAPDAPDKWARELRRASIKLAEAIAEARS